MIKIAVLIPYRNDRPLFMSNLYRMLREQTVQPHCIHIVDYPAKSREKDITPRYRDGYNYLSAKDYNVIFLMEVDDWYSPKYIETMLIEWQLAGRPQIFGTSYTIYYHIRHFAYYKMIHFDRSSAMSTMLIPGLNITWPLDNDPFADMWMWTKSGLRGSVFTPKEHICLGIKHGVGLFGGGSHVDNVHRYTTGKGCADPAHTFLKSICDPDSFEFYNNYFNVK